jgi:murein DD-endopeptidase MepM/ murein hydrolase activator NlpD
MWLLILFWSSFSWAGSPPRLLWPVNCVPGADGLQPGYVDDQKSGKTHDCSAPGYPGHEGTDIPLKDPSRMNIGVDVFAAAAGKVLWVFDGHYDHCPDSKQPDCAMPTSRAVPGLKEGVRVCTELGSYCGNGTGKGQCFWCFDGGNVVVIQHFGLEGVFATRYDHLKRGSIRVKVGDTVAAGQVIAQVGSAGRSTQPHLHFEVWGSGFYDPVDPWPGACNTRVKQSLWKNPEKPWATLGR